MEKIQEVVASIASGNVDADHPMLQSRPIKKTGYVVITSDRGLAGPYNSNILRNLYRTIQERHRSKDEYVVIPLGKVGTEFCKRMELPIAKSIVGLDDQPEFAEIKEITSYAVNLFEDEEVVSCTYTNNHYVSANYTRSDRNKTSALTNINEKESTSAHMR